MRWTIYSITGLSNRLKVLTSAKVLAARAGADLEFLWPLHVTCNCPYERLFTPDPRVKNVAYDLVDELPRRTGWNVPPPDLLTHVGDVVLGYMSWLVRPDLYPAHAGLRQQLAPALDALVPTPEIQARVSAFASEHFHRPMIGVHLRRGDFHLARPDVSANTDAALRVIDQRVARSPGAGIFLATDDGAPTGPGGERSRHEGVRETLRQRYGERVVWTTPRSLDRNDPGAIEDALVDLLLLRKTASIVGTNASSFSELAAFGRHIELEMTGGQNAAIQERELLLRRLRMYPLFMRAAQMRLGHPPKDFYEAWHALRFSPWGDKVVALMRRVAPTWRP